MTHPHFFRIAAALALLAALILPPLPGSAQSNEGNLVANPGFEEPAAKDPNTGWAFVNHGQGFIRAEIQAQDYRAGLKAATVAVPQPLKVYACWAQHVRVADDGQLPDEVSVWYRAPDSPCQLVMSYIALEDGKGVHRGNFAMTLEPNRDWKRAVQKVDVPFGTRDILLELRVAKEGRFAFDEVALVRREKAAFTGQPYRVLFVGLTPNASWQEALQGAGWAKVTTETWGNLTAGLLRECRLVVIGGLPTRGEILPDDEATADLLHDYVQAGGGLLLTQQSEQVVTAMSLHFYLAERLGTRILFERTISDPAATQRIGQWGQDAYSYTDRVSGPVAEGVKGVLYQSYVDMESFAGVLPFLPSEPWQVTLAAGPGSHSEPCLVGLEEMDRHSREKGFGSDVPLAGVRDLGKGRAGYLGFLANNLFARRLASDEDRKVHAAYLATGWEGHKSDLQRFVLNTFAYLSGNADALASAQLVKRTAAPGTPLTTAWKLHQGIVGPRTTYSTGTSTPDEYAAKARAAGLDFVIFLEEFAALKPGGFEALKKDCRRLTGGGFLALAGITYQNTDGNHEYAFGRALKLPSRIFLDEAGKRFKVYPRGPDKSSVCLDQTWIYQLLGFDNSSGWYLFRENPYPSYDMRDVNSMAVVTQEGGRTLESVPNLYAREARNGQYLWPVALTLMKSAGEIELVSKGVYHRNVVGAAGTQRLEAYFGSYDARAARNSYPGFPPFGMTSATNGPMIEMTIPRGDTDADGDLYHPNLQEWELDLKVRSEAGLREVLLMDGDRVIRRFLPRGAKRFAYKTSLTKERQRHVWARARDVRGGDAVGRDSQSDSWILRELQCGDRNNQLLASMQKRPDGTPFYITYGGETALPDKGPWNGRIRPVGCFVFDEKLGQGMVYDGSPEAHPQASLNPYLLWDGKRPDMVGWSRRLVPDREGAPHVRPHRVVACSDVLIGERVLDGVFPYDAKPIYHCWHSIYPVKPSQHLKTTARVSYYLTKPDGVSAYLWEQSFQVLKDVPVKPDAPYAIGLGGFWSSTARELLIATPGQAAEKAPLAAQAVRIRPFDRGSYLGFLNSPFGSLVVYSLSDGLVIDTDGVNSGLGIGAPGPVLRAGTKLTARLLLVGMHRQVADPQALAARVASGYGLGMAPTYRVEAMHGKVAGREYQLRLAAGPAGCFRGRLTGVAGLPGNLGCAVAGLNDRWTACFQVQGAKPRIRLIPVEGGTAYAIVRAEDEGKTLSLGHPVTADRPEVALSLARTKDWKRWRLEVHNPTGKPIVARVRANPHFRGFRLNETIRLAPGASTFRDLGPVEAP